MSRSLSMELMSLWYVAFAPSEPAEDPFEEERYRALSIVHPADRCRELLTLWRKSKESSDFRAARKAARDIQYGPQKFQALVAIAEASQQRKDARAVERCVDAVDLAWAPLNIAPDLVDMYLTLGRPTDALRCLRYVDDYGADHHGHPSKDDYLKKIAEAFVQKGDLSQARKLAQTDADTDVRQYILIKVADASGDPVDRREARTLGEDRSS